MIHAASTEERERLLADFVRYCEIESPSGQERKIADALTEDLRGLGLEVDEDDAGNLLARDRWPRGCADRAAVRPHGHRAARRTG